MAPGVPEDRAAAMEAAFSKTLADRQLLAEAARAGIEIAPMFGEAIRKMVVDLLEMPPTVRAELERILRPGTR